MVLWLGEYSDDVSSFFFFFKGIGLVIVLL